MYSIKNRDDSKNINKLISVQNQVKTLTLQDKLGKQNFHGDMKKVFGTVNDTINDTSRDITKILTETSNKNKIAVGNLNNKLLEIMNDSGIIASYLLSPSSKITNPEDTSQLKLIKDPNSNRVNDLLINKTITVTLYNNLLRLRDKDKEFEIQGSLSKMITNKNYNVDLANSQDKKLIIGLQKKCTLMKKLLVIKAQGMNL